MDRIPVEQGLYKINKPDTHHLIALVMWQDDLAKTSELIEYNFSTGRMTSQVVEKRDEEITYNIRYQKHYFISPTEVAKVNKGKTTEILDIYLQEI